MKTAMLLAAAAVSFALAGCGRDTPAENSADALEEAAEQSTPEAAEILENAADHLREENISDPAAAGQALQAAGNASAPSPPPPPPVDNNGQ